MTLIEAAKIRVGHTHEGAPAVGVEQEIAASMAPGRRAEFCSARALAHDVLASLGLFVPQGVGRAATGAPLWPQGVAGSIAHSGERIAVAVTDAPGISIGVDLEPVGAVPPDVALSVTAPSELADAHLQSGLPLDSPLLHTLLYVAKESTFKAAHAAGGARIWHPRSLPVQVEAWEGQQGAFTVPHDLPARGRWWVHDGYVYASSTIGSEA